MVPTIYYVRHGETAWNVARRLQGRHDSPLSAAGQAQARRCAGILRDLLGRDGRGAGDCDYVSSPLGRACHTMRLLREALGLAPDAFRTDARLEEISFGDWEGLTIDQVRLRDPALLDAREHDKWGFCPPGGESYAAVTERIGAWHAGLRRDAVVTAHGGTARALLAHLGIASPDAAPLADIAQGVVYAFAGRRLDRYG